MWQNRTIMTPLISGAIGAVPSLFQFITGLNQTAKGKRQLAALERPIYETPGAAKQSLAISKALNANPNMPGSDLTASRISQTLSNYARASRETSNPQAGLAMAQANANRAYNDLGAQNEAYRYQNQQNLQQQLGQMAQYQDMEWQMNKFAPYMDKYNEAREMIGGGQQNQNTGLNGISSIMMNMLMPQKPVDAYQVRTANAGAGQAQAQDSFITAAGKMIGGQAQAAINRIGLTPQQIMAITQGIYKAM